MRWMVVTEGLVPGGELEGILETKNPHSLCRASSTAHLGNMAPQEGERSQTQPCVIFALPPYPIPPSAPLPHSPTQRDSLENLYLIPPGNITKCNRLTQQGAY